MDKTRCASLSRLLTLLLLSALCLSAAGCGRGKGSPDDAQPLPSPAVETVSAVAIGGKDYELDTTELTAVLSEGDTALLDRLPAFFQHIYAIFIVLIGWGLFYFTDLSQLGTFLQHLFDGSRGLCDENTLNVILSYTPLLIAAAIGSTPLLTKLYLKIANTRFVWVAETLFCAAILVLATAALVRQSYSPFLYFRF